MPKETKATEAELEVRHADVMQLLCNGKTTKSIYQHSETQGWNVGTRQVDCYISKCYEEIHKEIKSTKKYILNTNIKKRYTLYEKAFNALDYRLCKDILADLDKLLGHYKNSDITINNNNFLEYNQYNQYANSDDAKQELNDKFGSILHKVGTTE